MDQKEFVVNTVTRHWIS